MAAISRIGEPRLDGQDHLERDVYRMTLSGEPDDEWIEFFDVGPTKASLSTPSVELDEVVLAIARSQDLAEHVRNIDERVASANAAVGSRHGTS